MLGTFGLRPSPGGLCGMASQAEAGLPRPSQEAAQALWPRVLPNPPPPLSPAPAQAQIVHAGQACVVKEDNVSERVYTIREGDTLVLQCLVTGHPRPQVSPTLQGPSCPRPTLGSGSERLQERLELGSSQPRGRGNSWKMSSAGKGWRLGLIHLEAGQETLRRTFSCGGRTDQVPSAR